MRKQGVKKTLIGFISLSAAPHSFLFVNIVFLTAYLQREDNEKIMSTEKNLIRFSSLSKAPRSLLFVNVFLTAYFTKTASPG